MSDPEALAAKAADYAASTAESLQIETFRADTIEAAQWANETARFLAQQRKAIEAERDRLARPAYQVYKGIRELYKTAIAKLEDGEKRLKAEALAFDLRQREAQRAALAAAAASSSPVEIERAVALTAQSSGMGSRTDWDVAIDDPSQIPAEFWVIDVARLRALAKSEKENFKVPGARAVPVKVPVMR